MSAGGGDARRLTHDALPGPGDNLVVGWSPDSGRVLFLSTRMAVAAKQVQAFQVAVAGGAAERLPLDQAGRLDVNGDGRIAYTRTFTDLALRKRYLGSMAEDVFVYDPSTRRLDRITDWKGTDGAPMWFGNRIYYLSDRGPGFRLNLWSFDLRSRTSRQVTSFGNGDIDWPSIGGNRITFQQGGRLWAMELPAERLHALRIRVPDDGAKTAPRSMAVGFQARASDVTGAVDYAATPTGGGAFLAAHGDLFHVDAATGAATDLTATPGRDEDHPAPSPDGRRLAYVTEDERSDQLAIRSLADGHVRQLTHFTDAVLYTPLFSDDGHQLAVADAQHRLWLMDVDDPRPVLVAHDPLAEIRDAAFSPDGRWLAYSTQRPTGLPALHLRRLADGQDTIVSGELDGDRLPAFSPDGDRLFFVSERREYPVTGDRGDEASIASIDSDGLYVAPLAPDPRTMMRRASALPSPAGRIAALRRRADGIFYEVRAPEWIGGSLPGRAAELRRVDPAGRDEVVLRGFDSEDVAADGRHVLFRRDGSWFDQPLGGAARAIDLARLTLRVDPRAEWQEMVDRAWRLDRDVFFSRVMNGTDWPAVARAYAGMIPLLGSRDDAQYLLAQIQGELATSHAFLSGLDADDPAEVIATPRLGADLAPDTASGRYRFTRVYAGDATRPQYRAPLDDPATNVRVSTGDYLLAIDDMELRAPVDPDARLAGKRGPIALTVSSTATGERRTIHVLPLTSELALRQHDWVEANRARVAALSDGRVGYVFLGDFAGAGAQDLTRQLQGQIDRDALVIDLRWNRGGFTSQAVLDLLRRTHAGAFIDRDRAVSPLPLMVAPRTMVTIVNAQSASDGDQFPYFFRQYGLGTIVGQRTWGGVQGIKGPWPLMDGTTLTIPKDSLAGTDGRWIIENEGVAPDIAIDPDPDEPVTGKDRLLEEAVATALAKLASAPVGQMRAPPPLPAYPPGGMVPGASAAIGRVDR